MNLDELAPILDRTDIQVFSGIGIPPAGDSMTSTVLLSIGLPVVGIVILAVRRIMRGGQAARTFELGAVSTRWLSELRRDEPWTRS